MIIQDRTTDLYPHTIRTLTICFKLGRHHRFDFGLPQDGYSLASSLLHPVEFPSNPPSPATRMF